MEAAKLAALRSHSDVDEHVEFAIPRAVDLLNRSVPVAVHPGNGFRARLTRSRPAFLAARRTSRHVPVALPEFRPTALPLNRTRIWL